MIHWRREYTFEAAWVGLSQKLVTILEFISDKHSRINIERISSG